MKRLFLLILLLTLVSCGAKKKTVEVIENLALPDYGLFATDFRYIFFGKIGYAERSFKEDTLVYPPIDSMIHNSVFAICPKDTCFAERAVLALRCPPIQPLLDWVADTVRIFAQDCPVGNGLLTYNDIQFDIPVKHLKTDREICNHYLDQLRHTYDKWHCTGEGDHGIPNEQAGLLLADCWHTSNLYTFYRIDWYDWLSGGNNARESWWTVDATSGKLLTLDDMIMSEKMDSLSTLMMARLVNGIDGFIVKQYSFEPTDYPDVLQQANGCALISEGLVIYFYPYNLGSGADGEYEAVIPYDKLEGILREPLAAALIPSTEDEDSDIRQNVRNDQKQGMDLFGIEMTGTPRQLVRELSKNPYLQIDLGPDGFLNHSKGGFSSRVLLDGNPFGMTVSYEEDKEDGPVKSVTFITSESDHRVIDAIVKNLKSYYGEPAIVDKSEEYYMWFLRGHFIQARRLHYDDGGWTFYMTRN